MRIEESIEINRCVEDVFAYASDVNHLPQWAGTTIEVKDAPEGPLHDGATFTDVGKFLGRRIETPFEATVDAPHRLMDRSTGGLLPHDWTYTFEPLGPGTRMSLAVEGEPGGCFRLARPVFERAFKRQVRTDIQRLKDLLEAKG